MILFAFFWWIVALIWERSSICPSREVALQGLAICWAKLGAFFHLLRFYVPQLASFQPSSHPPPELWCGQKKLISPSWFFLLRIELASQLMMTKVDLFTFKHQSLHPRWKHASCINRWSFGLIYFTHAVDTEFLSCVGHELEDLPPVLILAKIWRLRLFVPLVYKTQKI